MSPIFPGYEVTSKLYESECTLVYRARKLSTQEVVILKVLTSSSPKARDLLHFRREYEISTSLEGEEFARVIGVEQDRQKRALVIEDAGGEPLERLMERPTLRLEGFLELAISITQAVGRLHEQGVIHKDLTPSNILWNRETGQARLIDFGLSSRLGREYATTPPAQQLTGTLPYMSPEQTGRTNRYLDYRSDYYSMGVVFYELLTGRRPFVASDPAELIYCHLARRPLPAHRVRKDVPEQLSEVLDKLMSKVAEDRYQSAHGIRADLEECLRQYRARGRVDSFELGREDVRSTLQVSQRMYGREEQSAWLQERFEEACQGERVLALVAGAPGAGKSTLVNHLQAPVIEHRGWFAQGKFESNLRLTPYSACGAAMSQLVTQLLSFSREELARWRVAVEEALEEDAPLVAIEVPELELLLDRRLSSKGLDLGESRHRFRDAFRRLIAVFCDSGYPLVLFLDDLHWIDEASAELLRMLIADESMHHLLIIGAYRENEVTESHPLMEVMKDLESTGANAKQTALGPLEIEAIHQLVCDSIQRDDEEAAQLAEVVAKKTSGNPFFVEQFLRQIHSKDLLYFDSEEGRWRWNLEEIEALPATENVIGVLRQRLELLSNETREVLSYAALMGTRFSLAMLASVCEMDELELFEKPKSAVEADIVLAVSEHELVDGEGKASELIVQELTFAHDKIREVAQEFLAEDKKGAIHLRIGRLLQPILKEKFTAKTLFSVVEQFNAGAELVEDLEEQLELARLNVEAAQIALGAQAAVHGTRLLAKAQELMPEDGWSSEARLSREILLNRARAESLASHFERAEELIMEGRSRVEDPLERLEFELLLVRQLTLTGEYHWALQLGREMLGTLGCELAEQDLRGAIAEELGKVEEKLKGRRLRAMLKRSTEENPRIDGILGGEFRRAIGP